MEPVEDSIEYYDEEEQGFEPEEPKMNKLIIGEHNITHLMELWYHPVQQSDWDYNFTFVSVLDIGFGIITGALNAFPSDTTSAGSGLFTASSDLRAIRTSVRKFNDDYTAKKLSTAIPHASAAMSYVNSTVHNLFYGSKSIIFDKNANGRTYFEALIFEYQILYNWFFNAGFMWTDLIMIGVARPNNTEEDYVYFVSFYLTDFLFRFLFRSESSGNCWYPWNSCYANYY